MVDWVFEHAKQNVQIARKHKHMLFLVDVRDVGHPNRLLPLKTLRFFVGLPCRGRPASSLTPS